MQQICNYSYQSHFKTSETLHTFHRAINFEILALNQRYSTSSHKNDQDQIYAYERNAIWYFLHSALKGYSTAQYKLGMLYLHGQLGLDSNLIHAKKWLSLAANQGHTEAQTQLNRLYQQ